MKINVVYRGIRYLFATIINYYLERGIWIVGSYIWYRKTLFRGIEGFSLRFSAYMLCTVLLLSLFIGRARRVGRHISIDNTAAELCIGYGRYTAVSYFNIRRDMILTVLPCILAAAVICVLLILFYDPRREKTTGRFHKRAPSRRKTFIHTLDGAYYVTAVGMAALIFLTCSGFDFSPAVTGPQSMLIADDGLQQQTIAENIDILAGLSDQRWETLSGYERLDVLQTVADIERSYLGIPHELNVGAADLDEYTAGYYRDSTHEIIIDVDLLMHGDQWDVLNTVCHEAYHSYQHCLVDLYDSTEDERRELLIFSDIKDYKAEFSDYIDADEDILDYMLQTCETDARIYSRYSVEDYRDRIMTYLYGSDYKYDAVHAQYFGFTGQGGNSVSYTENM